MWYCEVLFFQVPFPKTQIKKWSCLNNTSDKKIKSTVLNIIDIWGEGHIQ